MGAKYDFSFASFFPCCVSRHLLENSKYFFKDILILRFYVNLIQDESFWDCLRMEGDKKAISQICDTYPAKMKLGRVIPYLKKNPKIT